MRLKKLRRLLLLWGVPSDKGMKEIKERVSVDQSLYVLIPEMRPHCFGLEIAKSMRKEDIKYTYATDNMLGILFYKNKIKEVFFFYKDLVGPHAVGICGSLYVCLLAHVHNVPIKPIQGDKMIRSTQKALLLDEYMHFQYNDGLKAEDEYVSMDII